MSTTKENNEANRLIDEYNRDKSHGIIREGKCEYFTDQNGCIVPILHGNVSMNLNVFKAMFDKLDNDIMKD